jgi:hypothetical protein
MGGNATSYSKFSMLLLDQGKGDALLLPLPFNQTLFVEEESIVSLTRTL